MARIRRMMTEGCAGVGEHDWKDDMMKKKWQRIWHGRGRRGKSSGRLQLAEGGYDGKDGGRARQEHGKGWGRKDQGGVKQGGKRRRARTGHERVWCVEDIDKEWPEE